jgi:hypothetical protein
MSALAVAPISPHARSEFTLSALSDDAHGPERTLKTLDVAAVRHGIAAIGKGRGILPAESSVSGRCRLLFAYKNFGDRPNFEYLANSRYLKHG